MNDEMFDKFKYILDQISELRTMAKKEGIRDGLDSIQAEITDEQWNTIEDHESLTWFIV